MAPWLLQTVTIVSPVPAKDTVSIRVRRKATTSSEYDPKFAYFLGIL